ncbi:unnamed protein product [Prorocentrum cordatum]|uniref:Uncharacterized protein n=1 Tax=Prorocentrum cordatum TaxID=2364126 RepID=A0ABN9Y452_9DINO|nr:unnamed protein product [Polarella glacialis]
MPRARAPRALAVACLLGASAATRAATNGTATAAADSEAGRAVDAALSAVQGALLLSAALPQHDGPRPSRQTEEQMSRAGSLVYNSYQLLASAQQHVEFAREQLQAGDHAVDVAPDIASGDSLVQLARARLTEGDSLSQKARGDFVGGTPADGADPLGPPPEVPREWDNVDKMLRRSRAKLVMLQETVQEAKKLARKAGQKLRTVSAKDAAAQEDRYGEQQDAKILDFLSRY